MPKNEASKVPPSNLLTTLGLLVGMGIMFGGPWAVQSLRNSIAYVAAHPKVPCAMAKAGCEAAQETPTAEAKQDGGDGCQPPSVMWPDGCWFEAKGPPCRPPAALRDGRCWVRELSPPMPPNSHHERKAP